MPRVVSITSSRADVSILLPVWRACMEASIDLHIFATGMHLASTGSHLPDVPGAVIHTGGADLGGGDAQTATTAMAAITAAAGTIYERVQPDTILVMGDRLDMLPAAVAGLPFNIVIVHLHGGEITEGALDDRARHALTKLAHFHCVSSEGAKRQLIAMGEEPSRIALTGAPGIDTLLSAAPMTRRQWLEAVGFDQEPEDTPLRLVTVHPETNSANAAAPLRAVVKALDAVPQPTLFTAPNSDPGGAAMRQAINGYVAARRWARFRDTLGPVLYPNALRHASIMIGNSSSGIIEAATFGLPVIDVGGRQKGREAGENVIRVEANEVDIISAMKRVDARKNRFGTHNIYGDGHAGPRVAEVLLGLHRHDDLRRKTIFVGHS